MTARRFPVSFAMAIALLIGVALSGCGGGSGSTPGGDGGSQPQPRDGGPDAPDASGPPVIRFTDVTVESGLSMTMVCGETPSTQILEVNGGGLGLIDYDNDGDLDVFVANGATLADPERGSGSRLFENLGDLRFRDVTEAAGIELTRWAAGVAVGDYDGDGFDDLYVPCFGANTLLRNLGDGRFQDVTDTAGVGDQRWGTSAAFGDLDDDGDLDLYIANYLEFDTERLPPRAEYKGVAVMSGPHGLKPQHDVIYENLGDGRFADVSESSGILADRASFGLNVLIADLDHDGRQDLFVGNDSMANFYYRNLGDMAFKTEGMRSGLAANADGAMQATMGMALGDVNADGLADLFTTNFSSDTNSLHVSVDGRFFDDRTQSYGLGMISRPYLGWACGLFDFDHDGDEDIIAFNGHVYPEATQDTMDSEYKQPPLLFARRGRRFEPVGPDETGRWLARESSYRTAAFGDLDGDGDVDIVVGELNGPVTVLRNDAAGVRWLTVSLADADGGGNRRGLGSRIELIAGEHRQTRWLFTGGGFQSSSAPSAHFAVPGDAATVTLRVFWPDGREQTVEDVQLGRHHEIAASASSRD